MRVKAMERERIARTLRTVHAQESERIAGRAWYRIENAAQAEADVYIYDEIGFFGVSGAEFVRELNDISAKAITLHLNTPGGDVFDAIAIFSALRAHPAVVTSRIEGMAASAGSFLAMAGERVIMARHAMMMIHEPFSLVIGDAADLRKEAEVLDQIAENIASFYAERAGKRTNWRTKMREETWYTDQQAVDAGLADAVDDGATAIENTFDLSIYANTPRHLMAVVPVQAVATLTPDPTDPTDPSPTLESSEPPDDAAQDPPATSQEPTEPVISADPPATDQEPGFSLDDARLLTEAAELIAVG